MTRKSGDVGSRAWKILRLALLWARKGGVFKRRLMVELRVIPKFLKSLAHTTTPRPVPHSHYRERQLSFDETPIFHVKMHRPASLRFNLPCITPQVDFDYDFDGFSDDHCQDIGARMSFLKDREEVMEKEECGYEYEECEERNIPEEEKGIDSRAEEFIAKFYEQMKLQRQISNLQYNEMLNRGTK